MMYKLFMSVFFIASGLVISLFITGFAITSLAEREKRAAAVALLVAAGFLAAWFGAGLVFPASTGIMAASAWGGILVFLLVLLIPSGKSLPLLIDESLTSRIDERDIMFARMVLEQGTDSFKRYYETLRPEMAETDEKLRSLPKLFHPGGKYYNESEMSYSAALFELIEQLRPLSEPEPQKAQNHAGITPAGAAERIKSFAKRLGAADVRITKLKDYHVYSHIGRDPARWGEKISLEHAFAVVFSIEMDFRAVRSAPGEAVLTESFVTYMLSAAVAIKLADYCAMLGYSARAHFDANYRIIVPAAAHDAGLGEIGRLGLLITPRHGPRVRLAAVTTDMPLIEDSGINFGVQDFCSFCRKCAASCPGSAISSGEKSEIRGVTKWQSRQEACSRVWRKFGTDCGMCLAVCPYSKPDTFYHGIVRFFCMRSTLARHLALYLDDIFYGKKP
jgi:ferredoxin